VDTTFRKYSTLIGYRISSVANTSPIPDFSATQVLTAANFQSYLSNAISDLKFQYGFLDDETIANQEEDGQDLPGMSFRVKAGETWIWYSFVYFVTNGTAQIAFGATAPPGSVGRYGVVSHGSPLVAGSTATFGTMVGCVVGATTEQCASFNGLITATVNGYVQLQGAQQTSTAVNTTFWPESFYVAFRL
jgi:hypothetical protein